MLLTSLRREVRVRIGRLREVFVFFSVVGRSLRWRRSDRRSVTKLRRIGTERSQRNNVGSLRVLRVVLLDVFRQSRLSAEAVNSSLRQQGSTRAEYEEDNSRL